MHWLLVLGTFLTIILSSLTTLPIIVVLVLYFTIVFKRSWVFIVAILGGLFIDHFMLMDLGATSLFLVTLTFMVFLYQRKFEIQTAPFVAIASFIGSVIYLKVFGHNYVLMQALVASLLAVLLFKFLGRFNRMNYEA
ncbi:hypothetical protein HYT32_01590 [Candidatus Roizmanbacteria bacterium]|nr:hypothetical protein [Candidatus Roizmanbacteria bacterium]